MMHLFCFSELLHSFSGSVYSLRQKLTSCLEMEIYLTEVKAKEFVI